MKNLSKLLVFVFALGMLNGCYEDKPTANTVTTYDVKGIINNKDLTPPEKAEQLALIGEQLSTPVGFMYADEVLDLALKYDPTNIRAGLYKRANAPIMELRGSIARLAPLVKKFTPDVGFQFRNLKRMMSANKAVSKFFNDGKADIKTEAQAQALMHKVMYRTDDLRQYIGHVKYTTIQLNTVVPQQDLPVVWAYCKVEAHGNMGALHARYSVSNCDQLHKTSVMAESGDLEVLQHIASALEIHAIGAVAYDATGGANFVRMSETAGLSLAKRLAYIQSLKSFGLLRDGVALGLIRSMASDLYAGMKWAQESQRTLCPQGWEHDQRPDTLFSRGLCTGDYPGTQAGSADRVFQFVASVVAGQSVNVFAGEGQIKTTAFDEGSAGHYQTIANPMAPLVHPVADLKSVLPTKLDKCGQPINLGDKTVGGFLPNADGENVAKELGLISEACR